MRSLCQTSGWKRVGLTAWSASNSVAKTGEKTVENALKATSSGGLLELEGAGHEGPARGASIPVREPGAPRKAGQRKRRRAVPGGGRAEAKRPLVVMTDRYTGERRREAGTPGRALGQEGFTSPSGGAGRPLFCAKFHQKQGLSGSGGVRMVAIFTPSPLQCPTLPAPPGLRWRRGAAPARRFSGPLFRATSSPAPQPAFCRGGCGGCGAVTRTESGSGLPCFCSATEFRRSIRRVDIPGGAGGSRPNGFLIPPGPSGGPVAEFGPMLRGAPPAVGRRRRATGNQIALRYAT